MHVGARHGGPTDAGGDLVAGRPEPSKEAFGVGIGGRGDREIEVGGEARDGPCRDCETTDHGPRQAGLFE